MILLDSGVLEGLVNPRPRSETIEAMQHLTHFVNAEEWQNIVP